jgi:transcriptional regulator with XRE-family HTH domain
MAQKWRERLVRRMQELGFTRKSLSLAAGHGETYVRDLLKGSSPGVDKLRAICGKLGVTVAYILDGEAPTFQRVHVIGHAASAESWAPFEGGVASDADVDLRLDGGEAIAVEVQGDAMLPVYRNKDILIGAKSLGRNVDNLIGLDCIVMTEDGKRFIKVLHRGFARGTFNLRSLVPGKADIEGVKLVWAAPITWIRRA